MIARLGWIAFGWTAQLAFAVLCLSLMWFLQFDTWLRPAAPGEGGVAGIIVDLSLVLLFAVPHSVLLLPRVRRWMASRIPGQLNSCVFCMVSCLSLWAMMLAWQPIAGTCWHLGGGALASVMLLAGLSWLLLGYSMHLSGFGWQTGLTPFLAWMRGVPDPPRRFERRSLHRWLRHPIYVSFLLVCWLVPVMTWDRLVLAVGFTGYIYAGSWAKDRRLLGFIGAEYRRYMAEVPGFPLIGFGPLGKVPMPSENR
jgi:protein-S-isoprenylcysteine O-methyltransferase Ste14